MPLPTEPTHTLNFIHVLSGTLVNVLTILLGGGLGLVLGHRLPAQIHRTLLQGLGLVTFFLGLDMAWALRDLQVGSVPGLMFALIGLTLGGALGEWWHIEERLDSLGGTLQRRFRAQGRFAEGFVANSLLSAVGPMVIVGALQNGLSGDPGVLLIKSGLDLVSSLALAGVYGAGVLLSAVTVLLVQGGLSLVAWALAGSLLAGMDLQVLRGHPAMLALTGTGGLMLMGIAINLLLGGLGIEHHRIRVGSLLPGLLLAPLLALGVRAVWGS